MEARTFGATRVLEEPKEVLFDHGKIPIAFTVHTIFHVDGREDGGFDLVERGVDTPYVKDYDAVESPSTWAKRFDMTNWCLLGAYRDQERIGGAVVAFDTPVVEMLDGRSDLSVLWDIRVHPQARGQGIGTVLFTGAAEWARAKACTELKVETQNINVPACRLYARLGCELRTVNHNAYPSLPVEIQLLWYKGL
jgi:GNAT superfamily N-acetyltransferase